MINKAICDKEFNCNPSNCECECDESCNNGEYLDYKDGKCRKRDPQDFLMNFCMKYKC